LAHPHLIVWQPFAKVDIFNRNVRSALTVPKFGCCRTSLTWSKQWWLCFRYWWWDDYAAHGAIVRSHNADRIMNLTVKLFSFLSRSGDRCYFRNIFRTRPCHCGSLVVTKGKLTYPQCSVNCRIVAKANA
jgi:hypothetical protein